MVSQYAIWAVAGVAVFLLLFGPSLASKAIQGAAAGAPKAATPTDDRAARFAKIIELERLLIEFGVDAEKKAAVIDPLLAKLLERK